jgi:hypothetical protein
MIDVHLFENDPACLGPLVVTGHAILVDQLLLGRSWLLAERIGQDKHERGNDEACFHQCSVHGSIKPRSGDRL